MKPESETVVGGFSKPPREFPCNFKTLLFCFLVGSILSVPCGLLISGLEIWEPPWWTVPFYYASVLSSVVVLPFWSAFAMRDQPLLRRMGLVISVFTLVLFILGLLFPALNT